MTQSWQRRHVNSRLQQGARSFTCLREKRNVGPVSDERTRMAGNSLLLTGDSGGIQGRPLRHFLPQLEPHDKYSLTLSG